MRGYQYAIEIQSTMWALNKRKTAMEGEKHGRGKQRGNEDITRDRDSEWNEWMTRRNDEQKCE